MHQKKLFTSFACGMLLSASAFAETVRQVYDLALERDPVLKSQYAQMMADKEAENIGRSLLLPQVTANGEYSESDINLKGMTCYDADGYCPDTDVDEKNGDVTLSQNIFNLEAYYDYQRGKGIKNQGEARFRANEQDLIVRVVEAYLNVLLAIELLETTKAEEAAIARQLEQTQQRFDVGLIAITDVQEAQASYDRAHVNRLNATGNVGIAFEGLEVLTNQPINKIAPLKADFPVTLPENFDPQTLVDMALANNPQLEASKYGVDAAHNNALARKSAHYPTLVGAVQYVDQERDMAQHPGNFDTDMTGNVVALRLRIPLYSGGGISAQRRQAYQQFMGAQEDFNALQLSLVQQARSLHLAVKTDVESVKARQQAIVSAQTALDATQAGYEVGTRNVVDVLNAEQVLYQTRYAYAVDRYQYMIDYLRLLQVEGILSQVQLDRFNQWLDAENQLDRASFQ